MAENAWQPISTAPTDREDVLLWTPSGMLVGYTYDGVKWYPAGVKSSDDGSDVELFESPTHWAPLPADPLGSVSTLGVEHNGEPSNG